ncbi:hypothetical protein PanWU01x14_257280 [Parasponia andersonii]|uniref:Uncharacterized protein n=1 Tax=Parasponia andersonii TaxID=3476 RepID=A0A2P5BA05_PARAD|nr:hypothetical protein PanWU01x14_257280 [Parasponia andersonii]
MFGQIRASSSSLESLERPTSKILKEDSLSIYEATLVKLKLGSQHNLSLPPEKVGHIDAVLVSSSTSLEPMKVDVNSSVSTSQDCPEFTGSLNEEVVTMDTVYLSTSTHPSSRLTNSVSRCKQQQERAASILCLFSKFKNAQNAVRSSSEDSVTADNGYSVSIPTNFSSCQSVDSTEQQSEREFFTSLPVNPFMSPEMGS